jgi:chlorophyll synthase
MTAVSHNLPVKRALPRLGDVAELFKPVTWFPPMWAFACGVVSSGVPVEGRWRVILVGLALTGPLVCAASQAVNDWYDRGVDAINEPTRPIPSGRVPGRWGLYLAVLWSVVSLAVAATLGRWGLLATLLGLALAWGYSMPPVRFKQNAWVGNLAVGISYEGLAWITGAAVMLGGAMPGPRILVLALLYSLGAHGMLTLNDYKAIEGDRRMGIRSLPATLGPRRSALVAGATILAPQAVVVVLLFWWGLPVAACAIAALMAVQAVLLHQFVEKPVERALWYSALGVPFSVLGMMVAAWAVRGGW